jgi:hypothetical protein
VPDRPAQVLLRVIEADPELVHRILAQGVDVLASKSASLPKDASKIIVFRIPVSKDRLRAMPKQERAVFFLLGYAANQINLLSKLVIFSTNKTPDGVEQILSGAQSQLLARLTIGTLHEAWELIRKAFLETSLGKEYPAKLDPAGKAALARLKKYFGSSNLIAKFRNKYSFHLPYDVEMMVTAFDAAAADSSWDDDWNWYFSNSNFNSFYFMSDFVVMHGILNTVGETDLVTAHKKIMADMSHVSENITQFIMSLTAAFWVKHFGSEMTGEVCASIDAPNIFDFWIPFFVKVSEAASVNDAEAAQ